MPMTPFAVLLFLGEAVQVLCSTRPAYRELLLLLLRSIAQAMVMLDRDLPCCLQSACSSNLLMRPRATLRLWAP